MRASDVVLQMRTLLPQLTGDFTTNVGVTSLTRSGTTMTAKCASVHGLEIGKAVAITGAVSQIVITSLSRMGPIGTLVTNTDHDLTTPIAPTVTISGANELNFNGTFTTLQVKNRRTIAFTIDDSGPTVATGSPILQGGESALRDHNGTYEVEEVPNDFTFTYQQPTTTMLDPTGTIIARKRPRISSGVNPERIMASYTPQSTSEQWLYVVLGNVSASKSRQVSSDATDHQSKTAEFRQQVVQDFGLFLFVPCSEQISAADARDTAEDLFRPICRSLLASKFDSGLYVGKQGAVHFLSHGPQAYNTAVYVHEYTFQQVVDLYSEDTVGPDLDVAFRDLDFSMDPVLGGTTVLTAEVDLDDDPL